MTDVREVIGALAHVYWLGGTSGAGKSTIGRRIASAHAMRYMSTDDSIRDHAKRCAPAECPLAEVFMRMTMNERWADRAPQEMFATFPWFHGEGFRFILEDLIALPRDQRILVEGFRLLPHLVKPVLASPHQGLWLISTPAFRVKAFAARGTLWKIPNKTSRPEVALANHLARESIFADHVKREADRCGVETIEVDGTRSEDQLFEAVRFHFAKHQPPPSDGEPRAFSDVGSRASSVSIDRSGR